MGGGEMNSVMVGPSLRITPGKLRFPCELYTECQARLQVENISGDYVAFKIKTNNGKRYFTHPSSGVLAPGGSTTTTVSMVAQSEILVGAETRDKFLVQSAAMPWGASEADIPNNLKETGQPVYEARLGVEYVDPQAPPPAADTPPPAETPRGAPPEPVSINGDAETSHEALPSGKDESVELAKLKRIREEQEATIAQLREALASEKKAASEAQAALGTMAEARQVAEDQRLRVSQELEEVRAQQAPAKDKSPAGEEEEEEKGEAMRRLKEEHEREVAELRSVLAEAQALAAQREEEAANTRLEAEEAAQRKVSSAGMSLRSELSGMRAQCATLLAQMEEVEARRAKEVETVYELRAQLAALQQSTATPPAEAEAFTRADASEEEAAAGELEVERDEMEGEKDEIGVGVQRWELEALQDEQAESAATLAQLRTQLAQSEKEAASARAALAEVQAELELTQGTCQCLQRDLEASEEELLRLNTRSSTSHGLSHTTRIQVRDAEERANREAQQAERLRKELEIIRIEIDASRGAIDELRNTAELLLEEKLALEEVMAQLQITDARHPQHPLKLLPSGTNQPYAGTTGTFVCGACLKKGSGWLWQCSQDGCDYDLHLSCTVIKADDPRRSWSQAHQSRSGF